MNCGAAQRHVGLRKNEHRQEVIMKAAYTMPIRSERAISVRPGTPSFIIGKATVSWKTEKENCLEAVVLEFTGIEITYTQEGYIVTAPAELEEQAYRVASYLANRLYVQTSMDAIDPESILRKTPMVSPENPDEEQIFKTTPKRMRTSVKTGWKILGSFEPELYPSGFDHSAAYGYFADAMRVSSPFQEFELLYKVVEYFFSEDSSALDMAVFSYVTPYDATFTSDVVKDLRFLRSRCVHPRARRGHINSQNIADIKEVQAKLPHMRKLASLLLEHPKF